jgi:hypothetical protein
MKAYMINDGDGVCAVPVRLFSSREKALESWRALREGQLAERLRASEARERARMADEEARAVIEFEIVID